MKISSESIKKKAEELGFQKVGVARAVATPKESKDLKIWLSKGRHATMEWMEKRKDERGDIHTYFPNARSVISVGLNYNVGINQDNINSDLKFSNYAWGDDYHDILKRKLFQLLGYIRSQVLHKIYKFPDESIHEVLKKKLYYLKFHNNHLQTKNLGKQTYLLI